MKAMLWSNKELMQFVDHSKLVAARRCIEICRAREERFDRVFGQAAARLIAKDSGQVIYWSHFDRFFDTKETKKHIAAALARPA